MPARSCPYCRELNGEGEARCYRCGRRLPGPLGQAVFGLARDVLGVEAPFTHFLVALELAVFGFCLIADAPAFAERLKHGQIIEILLGSFQRSTLVRFGALGGRLGELEPWRMLSAVFVHMGLLHVAMNLYTLAAFGRVLEREIGGARFVLIFVLSGLLGFVASEVWYEFHGPLTAGASGGVFGEIGAVVGIRYARRDPEWKPALTRGLIYAVLLGFALPVNTPAHLGGFFAGIVLGYALYREQLRLRLNRLLSVLAGLSLFASVASVVLSARSLVWQSVRQAEREQE